MLLPSPIQEKRSLPWLLRQVLLPCQRLDPASSTWNNMISRWQALPSQWKRQPISAQSSPRTNRRRFVMPRLWTPFRFDILAQLANIPAWITLYKFLRLSKSTREALREALADLEIFLTKIPTIPEKEDDDHYHQASIHHILSRGYVNKEKTW